MLQSNVVTMMQYINHLHNEYTQPNYAICRQILTVDIEGEYFGDNVICHYPTSVQVCFSVTTMHEILYGIGKEVWKIAFHSILEIFHSIHSGIFHIPYRNFRSIPFHSISCPAEKTLEQG